MLRCLFRCQSQSNKSPENVKIWGLTHKQAIEELGRPKTMRPTTFEVENGMFKASLA